MSDNKMKPPQPPMSEAPNQTTTPPPNQNPYKQAGVDIATTLRKIRTLVMVATIAGPISLFIGGVLLSAVGLVCGIIAYRRLAKLTNVQTETALFVARLKRSDVIGIVVCSLALVLNGISLYLLLPMILDMSGVGNYAGTIASAGSGAVGSISTWG